MFHRETIWIFIHSEVHVKSRTDARTYKHTLDHEVVNDTMEWNTLIVVLEFSFLSEFHEVSYSLRCRLPKQSNLHRAGVDAVNGDVK